MAIVKGKIRGGGRQLASYLLGYGDNEDVRILDVDGLPDFNEYDFRTLLGDFSRNELLTRSKQGIYHASYRPPKELGDRLTDEDWLAAASVLSSELPFACQRRAVVLHKHKSGHHIHIAIERYDHEKSKMIPIPHNYRMHDKARVRLEQVFNDKPTPRRNVNRAKIKECLTELWLQNGTAEAFIKAARQHGYMIAKGCEKGQFVVVNETARSFKLVSHLEGVRIKEVRERLNGKKLIGEKEAVAFVGSQKAITTPPEGDQRQAFLNNLTTQRNKQKVPKLKM